MIIHTSRRHGATGAHHRIVSALLACVLAVGMAGCGGKNGGNRIDPIPQAKIDLTSTDELVVYLPGWTSANDALQLAASTYKRLYPDVNIIVEEIGESIYDWETYRTRISTELMAGAGPDIVVCYNLAFNDIMKTMDVGAFLNLDPIIEQDESFSYDD